MYQSASKDQQCFGQSRDQINYSNTYRVTRRSEDASMLATEDPDSVEKERSGPGWEMIRPRAGSFPASAMPRYGYMRPSGSASVDHTDAVGLSDTGFHSRPSAAEALGCRDGSFYSRAGNVRERFEEMRNVTRFNEVSDREEHSRQLLLREQQQRYHEGQQQQQLQQPSVQQHPDQHWQPQLRRDAPEMFQHPYRQQRAQRQVHEPQYYQQQEQKQYSNDKHYEPQQQQQQQQLYEQQQHAMRLRQQQSQLQVNVNAMPRGAELLLAAADHELQRERLEMSAAGMDEASDRPSKPPAVMSGEEMRGAGQNEGVPESNELFECRHCRIIFPDCVLYTLHMGYHSHDDPFRCNKCGHVSDDHRQFFMHVARVAHE